MLRSILSRNLLKPSYTFNEENIDGANVQIAFIGEFCVKIVKFRSLTTLTILSQNDEGNDCLIVNAGRDCIYVVQPYKGEFRGSFLLDPDFEFYTHSINIFDEYVLPRKIENSEFKETGLEGLRVFPLYEESGSRDCLYFPENKFSLKQIFLEELIKCNVNNINSYYKVRKHRFDFESLEDNETILYDEMRYGFIRVVE